MDPYEVLGVGRTATAAELRRAHTRLTRQFHPALNPGDPTAERRHREVTEAYAILSDPKSRAALDRGERPATDVQAVRGGTFVGFDWSTTTRVEAVGFREIFDGSLDAAPSEPSRGEDLRQSTRLSFDEAFRGTSRQVHLVRFEACATCGGGGEVEVEPTPCVRCGGTGQVQGSRGHMIFSRACDDCRGRGQISRRPCQRCSGEGRVMASEWIEVQIPPGVDSGSPVRVEGCGNAGRQGGPAGDFILDIEMEAHGRFRREGFDLEASFDVGMVEAALGGHVLVETPDGPVPIEIPAGTQNGQRFRLRKRGMPRLGESGRGDLFVVARIAVPTVTDDGDRELLRTFDRSHKARQGGKG